VMWPLLIVSVIALTVVIERAISVTKTTLQQSKEQELEFLEAIKNREFEKA
jgi:hypothetical protein